MKNKKTKNKTRSKAVYLLTDFLVWCLGAAIYAVAVDCFSSPNNIAPGGVTGLSTLINHLTGFPIGVMVILLNIPILGASYKKFGLKFVARTLVGTLLASVFIDLGALFLPVYTGDRLLASMFGGAFAGIGTGLILLRGATTGGTDILSRLVKLKLPHISLGSLILLMNVVVMALAGVVYGNIESMLYSAVVFVLSSRAVDYVVLGAGRSKMLLIVTACGDTLPKRIIAESSRGVTVLPVTGAYTGEEKKCLLTVVRPNEVAHIKRLVREIDPDAFVIMTEAGEVFGKGFKTDDNAL